MEQHRKQQRRTFAWLTSAIVTLVLFAPTAAQAVETYIQKPGH